MRRGDLVPIATSGDDGKPRQAIIIQSELFSATGSVVVLLVSGTPADIPLFRLTTEPTAENGLRKNSQIMIDKIMTVRREKVGPVFGRMSEDEMLAVTRARGVFSALLELLPQTNQPREFALPGPFFLSGTEGLNRRGGEEGWMKRA
ncbi:MAG: type II toxin-antitoxin system PemK/MazF family toxin [Rhizobium sp.]|nr:type II toxin-antitoxin system PemK/MazF family toxin [Rhizobium sp.]